MNTSGVIKKYPKLIIFNILIYRLSKFVDKFGPRLSGSDVLEKSIDYMINITREEDVNDIVTEEVEVINNLLIFKLSKVLNKLIGDIIRYRQFANKTAFNRGD